MAANFVAGLAAGFILAGAIVLLVTLTNSLLMDILFNMRVFHDREFMLAAKSGLACISFGLVLLLVAAVLEFWGGGDSDGVPF